MKKIYPFLKINFPIIFTIFLCLSVFASLFLLLGMDIQVFTYAAFFILFFAFIYLVVRFLSYTNEQIVHKKLNQANEKIKELENNILEERNDTEEYFLMWVHQMKTPITSASLLADDTENDAEKRCRKIRQELLRIEDYTNMAMNYLKLINPTTDLNFEIITLDDLIRPLLKRYSVLFIHNKIRLSYDPIKNTILTDPKWTGIIIEQLLANAIKYAKNEEIIISYEANKNNLKISDTGIGIRKEDLPRIFDKGFSGFNGKFNEKSTGLGLFLVTKISERLNQELGVESQLGEGTTFNIYFQTSNLSNL